MLGGELDDALALGLAKGADSARAAENREPVHAVRDLVVDRVAQTAFVDGFAVILRGRDDEGKDTPELARRSFHESFFLTCFRTWLTHSEPRASCKLRGQVLPGQGPAGPNPGVPKPGKAPPRSFAPLREPPKCSSGRAYGAGPANRQSGPRDPRNPRHFANQNGCSVTGQPITLGVLLAVSLAQLLLREAREPNLARTECW